MNRAGSGFLASLALLFFMSSSVLARDVCLTDNFGATYVLNKVPRLRPGGSIPLTGFLIFQSEASPLEGSAFFNAAGTKARFGIFAHVLASDTTANNFTAEWTGDATFAGTGVFDDTGSFLSGGNITLTVVNCSTVVVP
jgi:hypothetical protein